MTRCRLSFQAGVSRTEGFGNVPLMRSGGRRRRRKGGGGARRAALEERENTLKWDFFFSLREEGRKGGSGVKRISLPEFRLLSSLAVCLRCRACSNSSAAPRCRSALPPPNTFLCPMNGVAFCLVGIPPYSENHVSASATSSSLC